MKKLNLEELSVPASSRRHSVDHIYFPIDASINELNSIAAFYVLLLDVDEKSWAATCLLSEADEIFEHIIAILLE